MGINIRMQIASNRFDQYIMVAPGSDYGVAMWSDLKKVDNVSFFDYVIDPSKSFLNLLHHLHFSFAINSAVPLPFQSLWKRQYMIRLEDISINKRTCIIFTDISACRVDTKFLEKLHDISSVTMVLVLVNIYSSKDKLLDKRKEFFDLIYSFDEVDSKRYGFIHHPTFYSVVRDDNCSNSIDSDAFFVGVSKGNRHDILKYIFESIQIRNGNSDFYISGCKEQINRQSGIHYDEWLDYNAVLDHVMKSNCVVEIMGEGQVGLTLRSMEAIVYNKKLLTNNKSVKSLSYYDSGYIQYYEDISDIDIDFILDRENVNYHYKGEFSPIHFLELIENCD